LKGRLSFESPIRNPAMTVRVSDPFGGTNRCLIQVVLCVAKS